MRLTAYSAWRSSNLRWRRSSLGVLAAGKSAEDLAAEAIEKVLSGERRWDPARGELLPYLRGVVDSLASHLATSHDNRLYADLDQQPDPAAPPAADDCDSEKLDALRSLLRAEGQRPLLEVIDAVTLHCEPTPRALAETLGTSVTDINNRLKRLRRCALRVVAELEAAKGVEVTHG